MSKIYVKVTAEHDENGKTKPLALTWTNGKQYGIDRVTDARMAPSLKGGGLGMRYTVVSIILRTFVDEDPCRVSSLRSFIALKNSLMYYYEASKKGG